MVRIMGRRAGCSLWEMQNPRIRFGLAGIAKEERGKMKKISIIFRNPPVFRRGNSLFCLYLNDTLKL